MCYLQANGLVITYAVVSSFDVYRYEGNIGKRGSENYILLHKARRKFWITTLLTQLQPICLIHEFTISYLK